MSSHSGPDDKSKPVLKDKNPHNYRKVGFSMIVISVSLVAIGLIVWAIGSDYHFASNIMAAQEVTSMTPKAGYQIVLYDYTQPIGAKLKLLDQAGTWDAAQALQQQYAQQNTDTTGQVLIFGTSADNNTNLVANAEVATRTPKQGYNVLLFNTAYPVGAKLTKVYYNISLDNATQYEQNQVTQNKDPDVKVVLFTPSFTDDLKTITGSDVPDEQFVAFASESSAAANMQQAAGNQSTTASTSVATQSAIASNQTSSSVQNTNVKATASAIVPTLSTNQTSTGAQLKNTTSISTIKSVILSENVTATSSSGK